MTEDFLLMIMTCGEIIPSEKTKLVKRIKMLKDDQLKGKAQETLNEETSKQIKDLEKIIVDQIKDSDTARANVDFEIN